MPFTVIVADDETELHTRLNAADIRILQSRGIILEFTSQVIPSGKMLVIIHYKDRDD